MAKMKFDGMIEAVRYAADGQIELVRVYERRGAAFSDIILINRADLVTRIKSGQKFVTGVRKEFLGSTFELARIVQLDPICLTNCDDVITTIDLKNRDVLPVRSAIPIPNVLIGKPIAPGCDKLEEVPWF